MNDNEIIAEFMGLTIITDGISKFDTDFKLLKRYNESWNDLMPVYNKLSLEMDVAWKITSKGVQIHTHIGQPIGDFDGKWEINCPEDVIEDAYRAIVAFIKWYNQQKS